MARLSNGLNLRDARPPRRAAIDPAQQHRRALLAKIHVAKKEIGLIDDDYRQIVFDVTGQISAGDCDAAALLKVIERFKERGWKPTFSGKPGKPQPADHPGARKARALWISLHHLGAVGNPSEAALETFAKRQLQCERMQWANQAQMYKLIEALKKMAERAGWSQCQKDLAPGIVVPTLKLRLCELLLRKLITAGIAAPQWRLPDAARALAGIEPEGFHPRYWSVSDLDLVAKALGNALRAAEKAA